MTTNDETVCQEALALLRQETRLTDGFSAGGASLTKAESACLRAFDYARRAFLAAHDWNFARARAAFAAAKPSGAIRVVDVTDASGDSVQWRLDGQTLSATGGAYTVYTRDAEDVTAWPALARAAFVAYLARELCIPVTGRLEDLKAIDALATERMNAARLADLREGSPADDRAAEVLALLRTGDALTGAAEADGVEAATRRLALFVRSATTEVIAAHDWGVSVTGYDALPALAKSAVLALAAQKIAVRVGAGAEHANALHSLYEVRLQRARIRHLSDGIAATGDALQKEVLARLLGEFAEDEKALGFNVAAYTGRIGAVSETVLGAINDAHDWGATFAAGELEGTLREAYVLGVCAALAATVGVSAERAAEYRKEYEAKIVQARVKRLTEQLAASSNPVLAELVANFQADDAGLVHVFDIYTARIGAVRSGSEAEVRKTLGLASSATLDALASECVNALSVAKLATACGLDASVKQLKEQEYAAKVAEWRKVKLNESLASNTDPVLAELLANFKADDAGLANAFDIYTARKTAVATASEAEVRKTLGLASSATLDALASECVNALSVAKLATACGLDASVKQLKEQEYAAKVAEWRKVKLNESLASNTDPVLAELLANFKADDAGLANAFDIYTARVSAVRSDAEAEVEAAHDWPTLTGSEATNLAALKSAAVSTRILEKLSVSTGVGEGAAQRYAREFQEKVLAARVYALEREPQTTIVATEVAAVLRPMQGLPSAALPRSIASRVTELLEFARREVLGAHRWNFARASMKVRAGVGPDGECLVAVPADCGRVEAVKRPGGDLADWSMRGDWIVARGPVESITYIRDVEVDEWPPDARRALVYRIAAEIATQGGDDRYMQMYEKQLSDAAVHDARQGNPGRAAWGHGRFSGAMRGDAPHWMRSPRHG